MSEIFIPGIYITDKPLLFVARNKDHTKFFSILKENRERIINLNTYHNVLEINYTNTIILNPSSAWVWEKTEYTWFGVSYEILDAMFQKYKQDKLAIAKLAKFCMNSKSKTYWLKIKNTDIAKDIMAAMLGGNNENT